MKIVFSLADKFLPDTVDVLDGVTDLTTHLLLITLHLRGTERRSLDRGYREQGCITVEEEKLYDGERERKAVFVL